MKKQQAKISTRTLEKKKRPFIYKLKGCIREMEVKELARLKFVNLSILLLVIRDCA